MANIQIPVTENGTLTLATAGKYCDSNIDVNVSVADSASPSLKTVTTTIVNNKTAYPPVMLHYINASGTKSSLYVMPGSTAQAETANTTMLVFERASDSTIECSAGVVRKLDVSTNNVWIVTQVTGDTYTVTDLQA